MVLRQPEEEYQSLEMKYESVSSFRLQRDKKNNNLKYTTHSTLLCFFFFLKEKKMLSFANLPQNVLAGVRGTNILWRQGRDKKLSRMNKVCLRASVQPECTRMVRCNHVDIGVLYFKCVSLLSTR